MSWALNRKAAMPEVPSAETPADAKHIGIGEVLVLREYYVDAAQNTNNGTLCRLNAGKAAQLLDELIERRRKEQQGA